jgi:glycosyltransferase involved in cell wall biosynthesis
LYRDSRQIIVAPRGQFSPGALALKSLKKRFYVWLVKALGLFKNVVWHASSEFEMKDILSIFPAAKVSVAPILSPLISAGMNSSRDNYSRRTPPKKTVGALNLIFLSRVSPMKNLEGALKLLARLRGQVFFDIYGIIGDCQYWSECQALMASLPPNIRVRYLGEAPFESASKVFEGHHFLLLPTRGENFGHVIIESLVAGCPVLISDQTPWRNLEKEGVGWDLPLDPPDKFASMLQRCVDMQNAEYARMAQSARRYGEKVSQDGERIEQNRRLFLS